MVPCPVDPGLPDDALIALVRAGDRSAFEALVRRHTDRIYALGLGMMRDPVDAGDVVQETFLQAWRRLADWRGEAPFRAWLYRIATNACLMKMRTRRRHPESPLDLPGPDETIFERQIPDVARLTDERLADRQLGDIVLAAGDALPDAYRAVWVMADLEQASMQEIAAALDLSVANVKTRLHRARLKLREVLIERLATPSDEEERA
jgi:RNA polymerase sigma-70 factor, ECF subfamily